MLRACRWSSRSIVLGTKATGRKDGTMQEEGFTWRVAAVLVGRLIFAGVFIMAAAFKFADMNGTASFIAAAGFPASTLLAWCAALFETALIFCLLTGAFFSPAALLAGAYVIFLAIFFHGPGRWAGNQAEFGFFVDHFTFLAGLLFAAAHGPGRVLALGWGRRG